MVFFGDPENKSLSEKVAKRLNIKSHYPEVHIFPDKEKRIRILEEVLDEDIILLKSISNPVEENFVEFLFIVDALKRNGARSIYAIISYLGYSRADHVFRLGEAVPLEVLIKIIENSKIDKVMLIDPHSIKTPDEFAIPVADGSALPVFAEKIKELGFKNNEITVVSPDMGGIRRIKILSELLDGAGYATINKDRDLETGKIKDTEIEGELKENCFVVDDMISTGGTIVEACSLLDKKGVKNIYVFATHPILAADAPKILQDSQAKKIFVTDTVPVSKDQKFEKLEILSIDEIIANRIKNI